MMERKQAFKTLRLDPSADGPMVQNAYWTLVRQAQERGARDATARDDIDQLNQAYATLQPDGRRFEPREPIAFPGSAASGTEFLDGAVDWLSDQALRTRERWRDRNPEIAVMGGVTLVLGFLALSEGASFWFSLLCVALVFGAIWAPWRRV